MKKVKKTNITDVIPYHIAAIFYKHKLVCWGTNDISAHAEVNALRKLNTATRKINKSQCTLVVTRVRKTDTGQNYFSLSRPCMHCTKTIIASNIGHVRWSTDEDGIFDKCKACDLTSSHLSRLYRAQNFNKS